ncbi:MAG TPA: hypothetical protein VL463_08825 [Kofleriaceae bacterium]|jgi:hypothetical protein|nr:hypothetical protein [Kofleriaceae bacterium]
MRFVGALLLLAACPGPHSNPDAAIDAPVDAMCAGELFLTGAYVDWDSTDASFHGVAFATFFLDAQHMDQASPNGRIEMCIPATGRSNITVTSNAGDTHLPGRFVADPAVFANGRIFAARGITPVRAASFFTAQSLTYDDTKADLVVEQLGGPVALTLTGATAEATLTSNDGIAWAAGADGKFVLFANVTVTGTPHVEGPAIGAGDVPMSNGEWTMTTVVGS